LLSIGIDPCEQQNQQNQPWGVHTFGEIGATLSVEESSEGIARKNAQNSPGATRP
jgi:hypothetical protein